MSVIILDYPSHLRIELTQGCTRTCHSCPSTANTESHKFMSEDVFFNVLRNIDERVKRVDFSMHGEPLLNYNWLLYVQALRNKSPRTQISIISNADILTKVYKSLDPLIDAYNKGLNFIHIDVYDEESKTLFVDLIKKNKEKLKQHGILAQRFVKGGINIWGYHNTKTTKYILMSDESLGFNIAEKHRIRGIHTWAGNLPLNRWNRYGIKITDFPMLKKCTEPMQCLSIDIHGHAILCCADFNKSIIYGDLNTEDMHGVWHGETIQKVRYLLSKGLRSHIPACYFCNKPSFRIGLWPYRGPEYNNKELREEFYAKSNISTALNKLFKEHNNHVTM